MINIASSKAFPESSKEGDEDNQTEEVDEQSSLLRHLPHLRKRGKPPKTSS